MELVLLDGCAGAACAMAHAIAAVVHAGSSAPPCQELQPLQMASRRQCVAFVVDIGSFSYDAAGYGEGGDMDLRAIWLFPMLAPSVKLSTPTKSPVSLLTKPSGC